MDFISCYQDVSRADAYATLEFANTYYLAYRDLPAIVAARGTGWEALDFGCGAGGSTRFLRDLGFGVGGIDISDVMLRIGETGNPGYTALTRRDSRRQQDA